jgi:hypothetical protein
MDMVANLSGRQKAIVALTVATAIIHIVLGIMSGGTFLIVFLLNGLGYLALLAALYFLPQTAGQRPLIRWVLVGYAALTVILYFVMNEDALSSVLGLVTKAVEVVLIFLLVTDK